MKIQCRDESGVTRRRFLKQSSLAAAAVAAGGALGVEGWAEPAQGAAILDEFGYGDVTLASDAHEAQLTNTHEVLMSLDEDSLLKPFRKMAGMAAPGEDLGGWYTYDPGYDYRKHFDVGFAPGCTFGQWVSALARAYAIHGDEKTRARVLRLNRMYAATISGSFYEKSRFPAYTYDKLLLGLLDSHTYVKDPQAMAILAQTTKAAMPHLPGHAVEHNVRWRMDKDPNDESWTWDESYTMPENLFLAYRRGAGRKYYDLALAYLDDKAWFDP
ncbi:MAG TPA: beta-L-arabinofuranosidase domain-containing protein, partial [Terracidiphilus sp.]|nr:beta-L-arabinofuranosidase domain-containing protein [Terracidiphilus sp.]